MMNFSGKGTGGQPLSFQDPTGKHWLPGQVIPILRFADCTLYHEPVVLAKCDECEWFAIAPSSMAWSKSFAHQAMHELEDAALFGELVPDEDDHHSDFIP